MKESEKKDQIPVKEMRLEDVLKQVSTNRKKTNKSKKKRSK